MDIAEREATQAQTKFVTASLTLTDSDIMDFAFVSALHASTGITITLPAALRAYKDRRLCMARTGAAAVKVVAGADSAGVVGFGSAGGNYDTLTLERGGEIEVFVREYTSGVFGWDYSGNTTVAAAT